MPSTEMQLHLACYHAFDDIGSVIHSHPVWATMFAIAHQPIPACIDEFAVYCGGDVRCAEYAASGTPDVGVNAVKALEGRGAALIANHGLVAVGPRPDKVLHITALVERTAQIVWGARALGGPVPVPEEVNRNFAGCLRLICAPTRIATRVRTGSGSAPRASWRAWWNCSSTWPPAPSPTPRRGVAGQRRPAGAGLLRPRHRPVAHRDPKLGHRGRRPDRRRGHRHRQ